MSGNIIFNRHMSGHSVASGYGGCKANTAYAIVLRIPRADFQNQCVVYKLWFTIIIVRLCNIHPKINHQRIAR